MTFNKLYWDPTFEAPYMQLTNNLQTVTALASINGSEPTMYSLGGIPPNSGKYYWAIHMDAIVIPEGSTDYNAIGFGNSKKDATSYLGANTFSVGYYETGNLFYGGDHTPIGSGYTTGDIVTVALDLTNNRLWFYNNSSSMWTNINNPGISGNPADPGFFGGGYDISALTSDQDNSFYPGVCVYADPTSPTPIGAMTIASASVAQVPPGSGWTFYNIAPTVPAPLYNITHNQTAIESHTSIGWSVHTNMHTHYPDINTPKTNRISSACYIITGLDFPVDTDKDIFKGHVVNYLNSNGGPEISTSDIKLYKTNYTVVFKIYGGLSVADYLSIGTTLVNPSFVSFINSTYSIDNFTIAYPRMRKSHPTGDYKYSNGMTGAIGKGKLSISNRNQAIFNNVNFIKEVNLYNQTIQLGGLIIPSATKGVEIKIPGLYVITVLSYKSYVLQTEATYFIDESFGMAIQIVTSKNILIQKYIPGDILSANKNKVTIYLNYGDVIGVNAIFNGHGSSKTPKIKHLVFSGSLIIPYLSTSTTATRTGIPTII
jgi:hypothetical protein